MVQQHPVDERRVPAAILRWVTLLDLFRDAGHQVTAVGPNTRLRFERREFRGVTQLLVPTPGTRIKSLDMLFFALLLGPVLLAARRRFRPEIWFVDELFVCFGLLWLRLFHRRETVCYDVMGIHYYQVRKNNRDPLRHLLLANLYGLMEHITLACSTFVTTINEAHREVLTRWSRRPCHVIRDAADFASVSAKAPADLELPPKAPGRIFMTFVGKVSNRRLDGLFDVLPSVMRRAPELDLVIVGDGPFGGRYRRRTAELGLADRVLFTGFVPHGHLPFHVAQADIAYSDDWSDIGFPMKVYEYMALGAAILVEDTPAVRELMRDGENCLLYEGREGLETAILRLAGDPGLRERIGRRAAEEAAELHTWEDRLRGFEELFRRYGRQSRSGTGPAPDEDPATGRREGDA